MLHIFFIPKNTYMGTINKGILGGFSGTVGTVIGGSWKGIDYMRSQPARRSGTLTPAQVDQRIKFGLVIKFVQSFAGLVMISFRNYAVKMTGTNNAVSYILKNAITGTAPNFTIDYSLVLVSRGDLPNVNNPQAAPGAQPGEVTFTWTNNAGVGKAKPDDKALLLVYCPETSQSIYTTGSALRSAQTEILDVSMFSGKVVETYVGFMSADGKDIASSIYTGPVTVA
jgi:hypothetical protein